MGALYDYFHATDHTTAVITDQLDKPEPIWPKPPYPRSRPTAPNSP